MVVRFSRTCLDVFLLSQVLPEGRGPARGYHWENMIADHFADRGVRIESVPGSCTLLNHVSLSGLPHQLDATLACRDAVVIGEWKAYRGVIPKNELLRFRAATEDYYMAIPQVSILRPIMRVFGGAGASSWELRAYAAYHGIAMIDQGIWPAPVLASGEMSFLDPLALLDERDRRRLKWLSRPLQAVMIPQTNGGFLVPPPPSAARVSAALSLQEHWSDRVWELVDERPGLFEAILDRVAGVRQAA